MANYQKVVTDAGLAKLTEILNAEGTLEWTAVKAGDGAIGAGDPAELTDIISLQQTFSTIDVRFDSNGVPFIYFVTTNAGLAAGYLRREVGIFGKMVGDASDTLIMYLYAETDPEADYIPVPEGGIATIATFRAQIEQAAGLTATVTVDNSTVFLALDRWADHLAGGGGVDQHALATTSSVGLMAAADKTKIDAHINIAAPTNGAGVHGVASGAAAGFMAAADKTKLDGIQAGAQVNQLAFWRIRCYGNDGVEEGAVEADSATDTFALVSGNYIDIVTVPGNDTITISVVNVTPSSHIGSRGAQHSNATTSEAGFMAAADKTKLDGIATGAEVNQNTFATVRVGATDVVADAKQDILTLIEGSDISITPNAAGDSVTFALAASHRGAGGAAHADATDAVAGFMPAADKAAMNLIKAYYAQYANYGHTTVSTMLAQANTKLVGPLISPKGGINFFGPASLYCFEMRVNNTSAATVNKEIFVVHADDELHYQVDSGAISALIGGTSSNSPETISIPAGVHTLRFFLKNTSEFAKLIIADWLDNTIVWAAGGVYY